jgi:hypothetical protein
MFCILLCIVDIKCAGEPTTQLYIYIGVDTSKENTRFVSFSINTLIVIRHVSALSSHHQVYM